MSYRELEEEIDETLTLGEEMDIDELSDQYDSGTSLECFCGYEGEFDVSISIEPNGRNKYSNEPFRVVRCPETECDVESRKHLGGSF